jgi:hypothetical protein
MHLDLSRDTTRLRRLLEADYHVGRLASLRALLAHSLAAGGLFLCVLARWPAAVPDEWRDAAILVWITAALLTVIVALDERIWDRRRRALYDELSR